MNKSFDVQTFLKNFLSKEESSGFLLLIFAAFALIIVNSPLQSLYYDLKYLPLSIDIGEFTLSKSVEHYNVRETLGVCDDAYIINTGKVIAHGIPKKIIKDKIVREVYIGEEFKL